MCDHAKKYLETHGFTINEQSDSFIKAHRAGLHQILFVYAEQVGAEAHWRAYAMAAGDDWGWWSEDDGPFESPKAATASDTYATYAVQNALESLVDKVEGVDL